MEDIHRLWCLLLRYDFPHLLHVPRDSRQDSRRGRHRLRSNVAPWRSKNVQVDFDERIRRVAEKERNGEHIEQIIDEDRKENSMDYKEVV